MRPVGLEFIFSIQPMTHIMAIYTETRYWKISIDFRQRISIPITTVDRNQ